MKTIRKHFTSLKQAERYLNTLYNKYDHVQCISIPQGEAGTYTFEVK